MHGGNAPSQCAAETGILRPNAVFRPHFCGDGRCGLVAVAVSGYPWRGINAEMRMNVNEAWRDPFSLGVDNGGVWRCAAFTHPFNAPIADEEASVVHPPAIASEDCCVLKQ